MKQVSFLLFAAFLTIGAIAQEPVSADSVRVLQEVVVKGFEQHQPLKDAGAAINYIGPAQLERFSNMSILPALNATPGVHMEERSPGSYRLNLRGSTLRSPFGVRNVKVYWNNIPFTDPGGSTYLNQLGYYNINSIEVIKGPASSLYGAGTGGAVLISSQPEAWQPGADIGYVGGSYGLSNWQAQLKAGSDERRNIFGYTHQVADGYRDHTNMRRDIASWETQLKISDKQQLNAAVLYGDLYYQTPGGLTKAEYQADHRAARPAAGAFPSADGAQAAIRQQTFLAGITNTYTFSQQFQNVSTVYGAFSQIRNPTFRNYEKRTEPHFGGRTVFTYKRPVRTNELSLIFGGEAQRGFFNTQTFKNKAGNPDTLQTDDDINNWIYSAFAQVELRTPDGWTITTGVSLNKSSIAITRLSVPSSAPQKRTYNSEWAPRAADRKSVV